MSHNLAPETAVARSDRFVVTNRARQRGVPSHGDEGRALPAGSAAGGGGRTGCDYTEFCEGVRRLAGLDLPAYRRAFMEERVRAVTKRRGAPGLPDYLQTLAASPVELDDLLDRITVGVSALWRTPGLWERLAREVLPDLAARGEVRIWSAGCADGAEAYTLAAVCHETIPTVRFEILATDVDTRALRPARAGVFPDVDAKDAPRELVERWFACTGAGWEARAELKQVIRFEGGNLLAPRAEAACFDPVLCRNVAVHFTREARETLHGRLAQALRRGGYLVLGAAKRVADPAAAGLSRAFPNAYRRR